LGYVSLLPPEIKAKREQERKQGILVRIAGLFFIVALVVYAFLLVSSIMTRSNLESLRSERELLETQAAALEEYGVLYNDMRAAESRVNSAMGRVPVWNEFMQDIGLTLPPGIWLSDMHVNYNDGSGTFNMLGWAYNHSSVAGMIEKIETLEQLDDIRVGVSSETIYNGQEAVQFSVDAVLLPGPPYMDIENDDQVDEDEEDLEEDLEEEDSENGET